MFFKIGNMIRALFGQTKRERFSTTQDLFNHAIEKRYYTKGYFMCVALSDMVRKGAITEQDKKTYSSEIHEWMYKLCTEYSLVTYMGFKMELTCLTSIIRLIAETNRCEMSRINTANNRGVSDYYSDNNIDVCSEIALRIYKDWYNKDLIIKQFIEDYQYDSPPNLQGDN